ncbi:hypothetical protein RF55_18240, partial [Lasius niger]
MVCTGKIYYAIIAIRVVFSLFTLVKFDNSICGGLDGENGTCVAAAECVQRGGISSGVCANGYGVCCIVTVSCGGMTADNNTYFVNPNYPSTFDSMESCQVTLVKSHPDVCQYRLDFELFNIRGPETTNNVCTYDQFIVSGGNPVPTICGNNNGNHTQGMMPITTGAAGQIIRNNAFTLTGNTQNTQIASMTGASCSTDWLSIPCAINLGRMPTTPLICVDRLCGGTFNSEIQNLNASSVI